MTEVHPNLNLGHRYQCRFCKERFRLKYTLTTHLYEEHYKELKAEKYTGGDLKL
jgi:hypothetical protein